MSRRAPIDIDFMIACYCSAEPWQNLGMRRWDSSAGKETRDWLQHEGLVDANYRPTDRGKAWVHFICATPLPRMKWTMPDRDEIADSAKPLPSPPDLEGGQ
jgi:hypothetical protein